MTFLDLMIRGSTYRQILLPPTRTMVSLQRQVAAARRRAALVGRLLLVSGMSRFLAATVARQRLVQTMVAGAEVVRLVPTALGQMGAAVLVPLLMVRAGVVARTTDLMENLLQLPSEPVAMVETTGLGQGAGPRVRKPFLPKRAPTAGAAEAVTPVLQVATLEEAQMEVRTSFGPTLPLVPQLVREPGAAVREACRLEALGRTMGVAQAQPLASRALV
jgi:hypothetical protein